MKKLFYFLAFVMLFSLKTFAQSETTIVFNNGGTYYATIVLSVTDTGFSWTSTSAPGYALVRVVRYPLNPGAGFDVSFQINFDGNPGSFNLGEVIGVTETSPGAISTNLDTAPGWSAVYTPDNSFWYIPGTPVEKSTITYTIDNASPNDFTSVVTRVLGGYSESRTFPKNAKTSFTFELGAPGLYAISPQPVFLLSYDPINVSILTPQNFLREGRIPYDDPTDSCRIIFRNYNASNAAVPVLVNSNLVQSYLIPQAVGIQPGEFWTDLYFPNTSVVTFGDTTPITDLTYTTLKIDGPTSTALGRTSVKTLISVFLDLPAGVSAPTSVIQPNGSTGLSNEQLHFITQGSKSGINVYGMEDSRVTFLGVEMPESNVIEELPALLTPQGYMHLEI